MHSLVLERVIEKSQGMLSTRCGKKGKAADRLAKDTGQMGNPCKNKGMAKYTGIHHLALATKDLDATIRFWRDLLGMHLIVGMGHKGYKQYFFELGPHACIAFFEWPHVEPMVEKDHGMPARGPFGFDHVSLGLGERDELWRIKDKLEAAEIWVGEVVDHGFIHSLYTFDPNNIPVEFTWQVPEYDFRTTPRLVDADPTPVALEGSRPQAGKWPPVTRATAQEDKTMVPGPGDVDWEEGE
jgi:catechol 2,3-dioxygenase-like lactoylglutathione lyase family enzyme